MSGKRIAKEDRKMIVNARRGAKTVKVNEADKYVRTVERGVQFR